eukprot:6181762-Pleurochrysis_carterae.AAC.1
MRSTLSSSFDESLVSAAGSWPAQWTGSGVTVSTGTLQQAGSVQSVRCERVGAVDEKAGARETLGLCDPWTGGGLVQLSSRD